ncbi:LPXTG cell wall anchor domain-containing protein [Macrococcoides canis]|uniref:LPXTG cell wall anchor domain-containing protein n=1 Tax=Macrococcoides canis TaxID=1855823 RepID=UPI00165D5F54|nr:LPXTG cell wall anchor domain-containing protein [Macrococcus canis]QNR06786.1 LPXTG cell wall anchor domain-containing protein [Macrococcus canis]
MNKMYNVLTSTALLGALVIGQSSIASAEESTSKTEEMPQSGTPYELHLDENGQPDMKENGMTLEDYIDEQTGQLDTRDTGVTYEDNMQQKDGMDDMQQKDMNNMDNMQQKDMNNMGNMQQKDMNNNMMKKDMKMLPDTGESDHTMLLAGGALLFAGIALSFLSYKRKSA